MAKVLQFRIELLEAPEPTWRVIQVPGKYTFWDLHVAIQDAIGWEDRHLHEFQVHAVDGSVRLFSFPDDDGLSSEPILVGWEHDVVDFMSTGGLADYRYDFGDGWRHRIELERVGPAAAGVKYPTCTDGRGACPPEDCGGMDGYIRLLNGDRELLEWLGLSKYRPPQFFAHAVRFSNPRKRWERAFGLE